MSSITTTKLAAFADKLPDNLSKILTDSSILPPRSCPSTNKQPLAEASHRSNIPPNSKHMQKTKAETRTLSPQPTITRIIKRTRTPSPAPNIKRHKKVATRPTPSPPPSPGTSESDSTSGSEAEIPLPRSFYSRPRAGGKLLRMGGIPKTRKKIRRTTSPPCTCDSPATASRPSTYASPSTSPSSTTNSDTQTPSPSSPSPASKPTTTPRAGTASTRKALDTAVLVESHRHPEQVAHRRPQKLVSPRTPKYEKVANKKQVEEEIWG